MQFPKEILKHLDDPIGFNKVVWPDAIFYDKQVEMIESVENCPETYVVAGNQLGKDYTASNICISRYVRAMMRGKTCRIVTTSVAEHHLKVLWGEISRWVMTARYPLLAKEGGPLVMNYMEIRRKSETDAKNPLNYLVGRVSAKGEGLAGHHAEDTMFVGDEASGLDDETYKMAQGWAKRMLIFGNPNECQNYFRKAVDGGDILAA